MTFGSGGRRSIQLSYARSRTNVTREIQKGSAEPRKISISFAGRNLRVRERGVNATRAPTVQRSTWQAAVVCELR